MDYNSDDNYYDDIDTLDEVVATSPNGVDRASTSQCLKMNYTVLNESEIQQRQHETISEISSLLTLPPQDASRLLCYYKWDSSHLLNEWFDDVQVVRNKVGLLQVAPCESKTSLDFNTNKIQCRICFDDFDTQSIMSLACDHPYCKTCWKTYIHTAIDDGPGSLFLTCPECKVAVTRDMIDILAENKYIVKYDTYFVRSYVDCKKEIKWCPTPSCGHAIEFEHSGDDGDGYDVTCLCSHEFCWNCVEEPHRPVDCELVEKWILKNSSEAENNKWMLAYSKPCPKCKRPIEKNRGCNHMICSAPCYYHFCWLCLEDWEVHASHYKCNAYKGSGALEKKARKDAKIDLVRYGHYYERWAGNHKSRQKAIEDLHKLEKHGLSLLSTKVKKPITELDFVLEAWKQIIECRRVLKWSYVYGYYLLEKEPAKQPFFEYLQGQAEVVLEKLHACTENELSVFLKIDYNDDESRRQQSSIIPSSENTNDETGVNDMDANEEPDFGVYRGKLIDLTKVTGKCFDDLVGALEDGLSEVTIVTRKGSKKRKQSQPRQLNNQEP